MAETLTFLDALVDALAAAGAYNQQGAAPPAAVLWPDKERQWEALLPSLRKRLPVFTLGSYVPEQACGPAYWLRCIVGRTIPFLSCQARPASSSPKTCLFMYLGATVLKRAERTN